MDGEDSGKVVLRTALPGAHCWARMVSQGGSAPLSMAASGARSPCQLPPPAAWARRERGWEGG